MKNTYYISVFTNIGKHFFSTQQTKDLSKMRSLFNIFCNKFEGFEIILCSVKHISDKECRTTTLKRKLYFKTRSTTV